MGGQPPEEKNIDIKAQFVDKREPRLEASIKWNSYSVCQILLHNTKQELKDSKIMKYF